MNILIDTSPLQNAHSGRGIGRYTQELLIALKKKKTIHNFFSSTDPLPSSIDLVHYPFFDFFFPTLPIIKKTKTIVTIHDVIPLVFAKHYPRGLRGNLNFLHQRLSLLSVKHIVTDSNCSKRDIVEKLGRNAEDITVVPLAPSDDFYRPSVMEREAIRKKYNLPKKFLLYVGDINYNKNIPFLIAAVCRVPNIPLVLVGRAFGSLSIPEGIAITDAIRNKKMEDRIIMLSSVDASADLRSIYSLATLYIQPSLYEGFGLPVIEAMRSKTLVVSSKGGSLPEVIGEGGIMFHPHDEDDCYKNIMRALKFTPLARQEHIKKGYLKSLEYSWERTASETIKAYESI